MMARAPPQPSSPIVYHAGRLSTNDPVFINQLGKSALLSILEACDPFIKVTFIKVPDVIKVEFYHPTKEELFRYVRRHGAASHACPNDPSLGALAAYMYENIVRKIEIGLPKDVVKTYPCGFSATFRDLDRCLHGGFSSDTNKCVFVQTRSTDPIWSPRCVKCLGKANPIKLDKMFRRPQANKLGRRHEYVTREFEKSVAASLMLCFHPGRAINAFNMKQDIPVGYLTGVVEQERISHQGDLASMQRGMPVNPATQYSIGSDMYNQYRAEFDQIEDFKIPNKCFFEIDADIDLEDDAKALVEKMTSSGKNGYMKIKKKYIVPTDMLNYARRIKLAIKNLKKHKIDIQFETRFRTQHMLYDAVESRCRAEAENPWILYDEYAKIYLRGKTIETPKDIGGLVNSLRRTKGAHVVVLHADQLGHRKLAQMLEAINSTAHISRMLSIKFEACYSNPRGPFCEKGMPVLDHFCRNDKIVEGLTNADWKRLKCHKKGDLREVLLYPVYSARDYGTILATESRNEIEHSIMLKGYPHASIRAHFIMAYKLQKNGDVGKPLDVLDLV